MAHSIFLLIIGLSALVAGAELLVRGGASLAWRLRIHPLVIGLTVVAFGTSAPELAVSIKASLAGQGDIAAGNIIGSNIFNIAAILGLSALIFPLAVHAKLVRYDLPFMIVVTLAGIAVMWNKELSRVEGAMLFAGLVVYMVLTFRLSAREDKAMDEEAAAELPAHGRAAWFDVMLILGGLVGLILGADWFVTGAIYVARIAGMSEAVIGMTIVAAGTSLPELATSAVAAYRRHTDIAIGNIVGSNIFNILAILGLTAMIKPFSTQNILMVDTMTMLFFALLLLPLAASGFAIKRWEGAVLLTGYIVFTVYRINL